MGLIQHHAVIATTWSDEKADSLQEWIDGLDTIKSDLPSMMVKESDKRLQDLFVRVSAWMNGYQTFILVPDGSKEGWQDSNVGDELRRMFIERLKQDCYEDGSSPWDWVEVGYGELGAGALSSENF